MHETVETSPRRHRACAQANVAQLSAGGGLYGSQEWLGDWWLPLKDVPPNLVLRG